MGRRRWLPVALAPVLVAVGLVLPQSLNDTIPWRYKVSWLSSVAAGTTPADTMQALMQELAEGHDAAARRYVTDGGWPQVLAHRADLINPTARASAFDVLGAPGPGTVIMDVGEEQVKADRNIVLPPQLTACLQMTGSGWKLGSILEDLACEDAGS